MPWIAATLAGHFQVQRYLIEAELRRSEKRMQPALFAPLPFHRAKSYSCVNCGAPWELICSYCGTASKT